MHIHLDQLRHSHTDRLNIEYAQSRFSSCMRGWKESKNKNINALIPYRSKSGKRGITSIGSKFLLVAWTRRNLDA